MDSSKPDIFFSLLKSGLFDTPIPADALPEHIDWPQIIAMAQKQTVMGLVFDAAARLPQELQPPKETREQMLAMSLRVMNTHALLDSTLAKTAALYRQHGIPCVLLKGQGIARCYRNPQLRQCGDIDLYIGATNYQRSVELAQAHLQSGNAEPIESEKHYHFNIGRVTIELHRYAALMQTPIRRRRMQRWMRTELEDESKLRRYDFNGVEAMVPSAQFDAFFIFYHAWSHFYMGGIGLRQLCDWAMALHQHREALDHEELGSLLRSLGLMQAWQIFGCIVVKYLGLPQQEMPFYNPQETKRAEKMMQKIMDGGNFGFYIAGRPALALDSVPLLKRKLYIFRRLIDTYLLTFPIIPIEGTCYFAKLSWVGGWHTIAQFLGLRRKK